MSHLAPVGVDHVGRGGHAGTALELSHDLTAGETSLCAAGVFAVGQDLFELRSQLQGLFQAPAAVGVEVDACIGEGFLDGADCLQLLLRLQDAALELGKKNAP